MTDQCLKCKEPVKPGCRWCPDCWYPGIDEDYNQFKDMLEEGHRYIDAAVNSGYRGLEEFGGDE